MEEKKKEQKKYTVKPPKDLQSRFEQKIAQRKLQAAEEEAEKLRKEEEERKAVRIE